MHTQSLPGPRDATSIDENWTLAERRVRHLERAVLGRYLLSCHIVDNGLMRAMIWTIDNVAYKHMCYSAPMSKWSVILWVSGNENFAMTFSTCRNQYTNEINYYNFGIHINIHFQNSSWPSAPYIHHDFQCYFLQRPASASLISLLLYWVPHIYGALQTARSCPVHQIIVARPHLVLPKRRIYTALH